MTHNDTAHTCVILLKEHKNSYKVQQKGRCVTGPIKIKKFIVHLDNVKNDTKTRRRTEKRKTEEVKSLRRGQERRRGVAPVWV